MFSIETILSRLEKNAWFIVSKLEKFHRDYTVILVKTITFLHTSFETVKHYPTMFPGDLTIENIPF